MVKPVLLVLVVATSGCMSYRPSAPLPAPATSVRVSFLSPRDVVARSATGDSVVLRNVTELRGSIVRAQLDTRLDSIRIRLGSARGPSGAVSGVVSGAIATVPREVFVRVEQRSLDGGKTLKVIGYVAGAVLLISLLAIGLALEEGPVY